MRTGIVVAFFVSGCSCSTADIAGTVVEGEGCSDVDGDGRGVGPDCLADDCDDSNPEVWATAQCEALCAEDPEATGCPCDPSDLPEPEACYSADLVTMDVGPCHGGHRTCDDGAWSPCDGQVLPHDEVCDELDNDCDGETDDGVLRPDGTCADGEETCVGAGEGCADFDVAEEGVSVEDCPAEDDCITLGGDSVDYSLIWIANHAEGSISKIDTRARTELGRYWTSPLEGTKDAMGFGAQPSRTSVDRFGNVVVGNRAQSYDGSWQSSITRVLASDCPDVDDDGVVETSGGHADLLSWGDDECVAWNTPLGCEGAGAGWTSLPDPVGTNCGVIRAVAVQDRAGLDGALDEVVWAGLFYDQVAVEVDRNTGEPTGVEADTSPCPPYGFALDRDGNVWVATNSDSSHNVCRFDTRDVADKQAVPIDGGGGIAYGIAVDERGRVWRAENGYGGVSVYDPADGTWSQAIGMDGGEVNGFHLAPDGDGSVWVSGYSWCEGDCGWGGGGVAHGGVGRIDMDTLTVVSAPDVAAPFSVAVDFDGNVWSIPSGGGGPAGGDPAAKSVTIIDPGAAPGEETTETALDDCGGVGCLNGPYAYSDMTGFQLHNATDPIGSYTHVFEGCDGVDEATTWTTLTFDATTPPGTSIRFEVRTGDDLAALRRASWILVGTTATLDSPALLADALEGTDQGRLIEVRVTLLSDGDAAPLLRGFGVEMQCEEGVG